MSMLLSDDRGTRMSEKKKEKKKQVLMIEEEDTRKCATPFFFPLTNDMNHFSRFYFPWVSSFVWVVCWFLFFPRLFASFRARWAFVSVHFFLNWKDLINVSMLFFPLFSSFFPFAIHYQPNKMAPSYLLYLLYLPYPTPPTIDFIYKYRLPLYGLAG